MDDGARSAAETRRLLAALNENGVTHLALTPHYYPSEESRERFLARRARAVEELLVLPEAKKIHFTVGAEVYLAGTLFNSEEFLPLCYSGTKCMLVEPEYTTTFTETTRRRIFRLISDYGITPVIAHIDRYPFLYRNQKLLQELRREGCLFQVNLNSLDSFFKRKVICRLFREGLVDFLGEDVHHKVLSGKDREKIIRRLSACEPCLISTVNDRAQELIFSGAEA